MSNQKPVLTISLLISNRPDTIPRCLDSLKPIMAAIPSELILIDTSKSDDIRQMLLDYTDQVYPFEWCQDFAKARNEGLKRAKGEWFMFLDDDEWFVESKDLIDFFVSGEYKEYGFANYIVRSFIDVEYKKYQDGWVTRIFRIEDGTEFIGKVHEVHQPIQGKEKYIDSVANHSGYVYESLEKKKEHYRRNSQILLKVLEEDPLNLRWQAQMVQEYRTVTDWVSIVEFCEKCFENLKEIQTGMERNHLGTLYIGLAEGLLRLKRHEESIQICKKGLEDIRTTEMFKAFATFYLSENYIALDNWKAAQKYAKRYLEWYNVLTKNKKLIQEQSNSLLVKAVFDPNIIKKAYNIIAYADLKREDIKSFAKYYDKLEWNSEDVKVYDKVGMLLVEKMGTVDYNPIFARVVTDAYRNNAFRKFVCREAQKWEEKDSVAYQKIAYVFAKAEADDWFIWYNRIVVADASGNKNEIEKALMGFFKSVKNVFFLPEKVYSIIRSNDIKVGYLWENFLDGRWQIHFTNFVQNNKLDKVLEVSTFIKESFNVHDWRVILCDLLILEKKIMTKVDDVSVYRNMLENYCKLKLDFYEKYCVRSEEELPLDIQAAIKIKEFIDFEDTDKIQALNCLKEVVNVRPDFSDGVKSFLHSYTESENQKSENLSNEMLQLRNQVLQQVFSLLDNGMKIEALQVVQQLRIMLPNDADIAELERELK